MTFGRALARLFLGQGRWSRVTALRPPRGTGSTLSGYHGPSGPLGDIARLQQGRNKSMQELAREIAARGPQHFIVTEPGIRLEQFKPPSPVPSVDDPAVVAALEWWEWEGDQLEIVSATTEEFDHIAALAEAARDRKRVMDTLDRLVMEARAAVDREKGRVAAGHNDAHADLRETEIAYHVLSSAAMEIRRGK